MDRCSLCEELSLYKVFLNVIDFFVNRLLSIKIFKNSVYIRIKVVI